MNRIIKAVLMLISTFQFDLEAQNLKGNQARTNIDEIFSTYAQVSRTFDNRYSGIKGSPYLFSEWRNGEILISNEVRSPEIRLKFDVMGDEVMIMRSNGDSMILKNGTVKEFTIKGNNEEGHFFRYLLVVNQVDNQSDVGYFEVLYDGRIKLYKKYKKQLLKANYKGGFSANQPFDQIVNKSPKYYFLINDDSLIKVKLNSNSVKKALSANSEIKKNLSGKKVHIRNESDLIGILSELEINLSGNN